MTFRDTILEALDKEEMLSDWEWDFIQNVADIEGDWIPTIKQLEVIDNIQRTLDDQSL